MVTTADFPKKLQSTITEAENVTSKNTGLELVVAANYGGRWDIINALKILAQKIKSGEINADDLDEDLVRSYISMSDLPDPDLFIRTGGEKRISNFLLWQLAYTELYFTETLWPEFSTSDFEEALDWFSQRERRFGRISDQIE